MDDTYDTSKTANRPINISGREILRLVGSNVLRRLYSWAFVKRAKSFVNASVYYLSVFVLLIGWQCLSFNLVNLEVKT
jgi:hypothetical protein